MFSVPWLFLCLFIAITTKIRKIVVFGLSVMKYMLYEEMEILNGEKLLGFGIYRNSLLLETSQENV